MLRLGIVIWLFVIECSAEGETLGETFNVSIPANIVADSFRAYLTVSGMQCNFC